MKALLIERNVARFATARIGSALGVSPGGFGSPLRLADIDPPTPPGPDWVRVIPHLSGVCGSDLATVEGRSSRWFEPIVSFPFVPGHEVVGHLEDQPHRRVVLEAVLGCLPRAIPTPCPACEANHVGSCDQIAFGDLPPALQTGFCSATGGGWAGSFVAHRSQLRDVPDEIDDLAAVMAEPAACAIHAGLAPGELEGKTVAVIGAGTIGLALTAALARFNRPKALIVAAKHPHQSRLAIELGADEIATPDALPRAVRRRVRTVEVGGRLAGGADVVFDCVGSAKSLHSALAITKPKGTVVLAGMPGPAHVDLTPLWQREINLLGAYAYGQESARSTFDMALELVASADLGRLVSARYPLERYDEALAHAASAGRRGAVKIVFEPGVKHRPTTGRNP